MKNLTLSLIAVVALSIGSVTGSTLIENKPTCSVSCDKDGEKKCCKKKKKCKKKKESCEGSESKEETK